MTAFLTATILCPSAVSDLTSIENMFGLKTGLLSSAYKILMYRTAVSAKKRYHDNIRRDVFSNKNVKI